MNQVRVARGRESGVRATGSPPERRSAAVIDGAYAHLLELVPGRVSVEVEGVAAGRLLRVVEVRGLMPLPAAIDLGVAVGLRSASLAPVEIVASALTTRSEAPGFSVVPPVMDHGAGLGLGDVGERDVVGALEGDRVADDPVGGGVGPQLLTRDLVGDAGREGPELVVVLLRETRAVRECADRRR